MQEQAKQNPSDPPSDRRREPSTQNDQRSLNNEKESELRSGRD
jgi:hypothetical protein